VKTLLFLADVRVRDTGAIGANALEYIQHPEGFDKILRDIGGGLVVSHDGLLPSCPARGFYVSFTSVAFKHRGLVMETQQQFALWVCSIG
jgi:hypothetical protein